MHELCHSIFTGRWQNYLPYPKYPGKVNVNKPTEPVSLKIVDVPMPASLTIY